MCGRDRGSRCVGSDGDGDNDDNHNNNSNNKGE